MSVSCRFLGGAPLLAAELSSAMSDPDVRDIFRKLAKRLRDEEGRGPRAIVEVRLPAGDSKVSGTMLGRHQLGADTT